jgi:hypothetical protein
MKTFLRLLLVLALAAGIALLAWGNPAWAEGSPGQSFSAPDEGVQAFPERKDDDCNRHWGKNKEKDRYECKDKGSVKPPPKHIVIRATGQYSVGGFCTISIELYDTATTLKASLETYLPRAIPNGAQKVRQGCLLDYYRYNQRIEGLSPSTGSATICFAAPPNKQMTVFFYNLYAPKPTWVQLETTVQDGIACADANKSGIYVSTFQKH